jgi:hypothetical protein
VPDFVLLNVPASFGHLEPSHIANGFPRAVQRILDRFFKPVGRRADYFNFFVNVFSHGPFSAGEMAKTIKTVGFEVGTPRCGVRSAWRADPNKEQICFTNASRLRQPLKVRKLAAASVILIVILCSANAQDQERKLVDRLLKPDMTLQNDAQNKKFIADGLSPINKRATVGTFYVHQKTHSKKFSGTRDFSTTQFYSRTYQSGRKAYKASSQQAIANAHFAHANQAAHDVRNASQSGKKVTSRGYAGNRPFLDEGKSQKSLNQQNAPLTIDQVRELLNKNK